MTYDPYNEARTLFDQYIKPLLNEIREAHGEDDAEYFVGSIAYHLRGELGWSVAYYSKVDALHYWCMETDHDEDGSPTSKEPSSRISGVLAPQQSMGRRALARRVHRRLHRRAHQVALEESKEKEQ